jgi:hypothetical protein
MRIEEVKSTETAAQEKRPLIEEIPKIQPFPSTNSNSSNIAQSAEKHELKFGFSYIERATLPGFNDKEIQENLFKWGMKEHMYLKRFSYDHYLNPLEIDEFLLQFFNDPTVNPHIRVSFALNI